MKSMKVSLNPIAAVVFVLFTFGCSDVVSQNKAKSIDQVESESPSDADEEPPRNKLFYDLTVAVSREFENTPLPETKENIKKLRDLLPHYESNWNYGNATHKIHIAEGRIALQEGRIEDAKKSLLDAGKTKGSPQLNSFGPNMFLAKELLLLGEKETVIQYLELCKSFWELEQGRISKWTSVIASNEIPDFGANLGY